MEQNTDHIVVDDGVIFDGTRDQFRNCFFDNANDMQIIDWCEQNSFSLVINDVTVL